jgi:hypothetical protein
MASARAGLVVSPRNPICQLEWMREEMDRIYAASGYGEQP